MKKISAHYYLRPDGSWGKYPILEIADSGEIISIREQKGEFKEEPGLAQYNGVIVPGFIQQILVGECTDVQKRINRAVVGGARRIILTKKCVDVRIPSSVQVIVKDCEVASSNEINVWNEVKSTSGLEQTLLSKLIQCFSKDIAIKSGCYPKWGAIQEGSNPGLLLVKRLNLNDFTITPLTELQVLA